LGQWSKNQTANASISARLKPKEETMRNGSVILAALLVILTAGSITTGAQAGSAQSSAPSKYNSQYTGHSTYSSTPVVWTDRNVGITEFSSSSAPAAKHKLKR
jgi:hypothetical protein